MYIYEGPSNRTEQVLHLHSGASSGNGSFLHLFNYISHWASGIQHYSAGGGGIQKMRFYIGYDASQQLGDAGNVMTVSSNGLGLNTLAAEITANLQIKGYGTTSSTKSLLVQDSAGSAILEAYDSGYVVVRQEKGINLGGSVNEWDNIKSISNSSLTLNPYWGVKVNGVYPSGADTANIPLLHVTRTLAGPLSPLVKFEDSGSTRFIVTNSGSVGIGTATPGSKLTVENGNVSFGSTSLGSTLFINGGFGNASDDAYMLSLSARNAANYAVGTKQWIQFGIGSSPSTTSGIAGINLGNNNYESGLIFATSTGGNGLVERMRIWNDGNISIGNTSSSARVFIKGSGTTSSTTALLVQNANASNMLSLTDNGALTINTFQTSSTAFTINRTNASMGGSFNLATLGTLININDTVGNSNQSKTTLYINSSGASVNNAAEIYGGVGIGTAPYGNSFYVGYNTAIYNTTRIQAVTGFPLTSRDATQAINTSTGGGISFWGDASGQGTGNSAYAGIRGLKANSTYINPLGNLAFYVQTGSSSHVIDETTFKEVGRFTELGYFGIGTSTPTSTLTVYKSGSTVLDVQGSSGQLFSVTDSLSGSLFSVNTVAGLPVIEAFSNNNVNIGKFGNYALKVSGSDVAVATGSSAPTGTAQEGTFRFAVVGGSYYIYAYIGDIYKHMTQVTDYESREFMIFSVTELSEIDFTQVCETSEDTVRKSVDGTKTFVKWDGVTPECVANLTTKEGPYTYEEILVILATDEWTDPNPMGMGGE
jgi:hypothetical protein